MALEDLFGITDWELQKQTLIPRFVIDCSKDILAECDNTIVIKGPCPPSSNYNLGASSMGSTLPSWPFVFIDGYIDGDFPSSGSIQNFVPISCSISSSAPYLRCFGNGYSGASGSFTTWTGFFGGGAEIINGCASNGSVGIGTVYSWPKPDFNRAANKCLAFEDWSQINSGYLANSTIELDCVNQKWIVTIAGLNFSGARCVVWQGEKPFGQDCFHEKGTGIYDKTFGPNGGPSSISIIAPLEIIITPTTLPIAYVGVPYSQFMSQTGPAMGSWLLKNYPMSNCNIPETVVFSIDASTGEITGTPSALAIWTVTIIYQGSDAPFDIEICKSNTGSAIVNGNWCPLQTTIRICPLVTITPASGSLPDAYVGVPYTQSFTSSYNAGSASNNWVLTGTIPPWATYTHNNSGSIASGSMTGTPLTTGVYSFVYEHSFSSGGCPTPSTPYTLNVLCPSITITPSTGSLATGTAGVLQTWLFTISGSSVAGTFTLNSGSLPSGVRIVSDHLTGTPTTSGSYSFELLYSFDSCTPITLYDYTIDIL